MSGISKNPAPEQPALLPADENCIAPELPDANPSRGDDVEPTAATDGVCLKPGEREPRNELASISGGQGAQLSLIDFEAPARGAGRPKGAKNKSTKHWVEYFLNVCDSPMIALGKMYSENTADLAKRLKCKELEAFKVQAAAATAVLPYIHQKQPTLIDTSGDSLPLIQLTVSQTVYNEVVTSSGDIRDEFAGIEIDDIPAAEFEEILGNSQQSSKNS